MDPLVIGALVIAVVVVIGGLLLYNQMVQGRLGVREAWSGVHVQLQRRASLIPNLVETVKGYAAHERGTFESVTNARAQLQQAASPGDAAAANNLLTQTLRSLFAVAEAYPELKADRNFQQLQEQLAETEDKIAYARNYYNARVLQYNTAVHTIPGVFVAGPFGFREAEFFEAAEGAQADVRVDFGAGQAGRR